MEPFLLQVLLHGGHLLRRQRPFVLRLPGQRFGLRGKRPVLPAELGNLLFPALGGFTPLLRFLPEMADTGGHPDTANQPQQRACRESGPQSDGK